MPSQASPGSEIQRDTFVVCYHLLLQLLYFLKSISAVCRCWKKNALEMVDLVLKINAGCYKLFGKRTLACKQICANECISVRKKGRCCLPFSHHNESLGWIGSSLANTVSVCVNIHQLFVYSLCVASSIISIYGLAASNYISNKEPQWEDSPCQQGILLFVYTNDQIVHIIFLWEINY